MTAANRCDIEVPVGRFGRLPVSEDWGDVRAVAARIETEFRRAVVEAVAATRAEAKIPAPLRVAYDNLARGNGARTVATVYASLCGYGPLHAAQRLAAFWPETVDRTHRALAPAVWSFDLWDAANEDEEASNYTTNLAQQQAYRDRSVGTFLRAAECFDQQAAVSQRCAHLSRLAATVNAR